MKEDGQLETVSILAIHADVQEPLLVKSLC